MALHQASGHWRLGLALALVTAGFWATLPAALKIALRDLDAYTLTWVRFLFAFLMVAAWLGLRGGWAPLRQLDRTGWLLMVVAAAGLIGNYLLYLLGVGLTTPGNAQLLIQAAPLLMTLGGILVFRERYGRWQWLGTTAIVFGLALFFADQLEAPAVVGDRYIRGSVLVLLAAFSWAIYALVQKQLLQRLGSAAILCFIYFVASVVLLPFATPSSLLRLDALPMLMVTYAALNTLGAYGAFAEALVHWEASRVSAILALTPLLAVFTVEIVHAAMPEVLDAESIRTLGWLGAALVVAGSALAALAGRSPREKSVLPAVVAIGTAASDNDASTTREASGWPP